MGAGEVVGTMIVVIWCVVMRQGRGATSEGMRDIGHVSIMWVAEAMVGYGNW